MPAAKSKSKPTSKATEKIEVVHQPKASDILCGKDKSCVSHEGSVRFRKIIDQYREKYCSDSTSKQQRMAITKEIVHKLSKSARFLKYDSKEKVWKTISALAARDKVSHALRFANLKENRRTGKIKNIRRRVSASSTSSAPNAKNTSPEDAKLWSSLVSRQSKLLESIKKGEKGSIPAIVELPDIITVTKDASASSSSSSHLPQTTDCDPLSINDSSFEENPTFQDYCLQLYRSESSAENNSSVLVPQIPDDSSYQTPSKSSGSDKCLFEEQSVTEDSVPDVVSNACDSEEDRGEEIASMITEPLMEWDLEHDGIFEV